MRRRRVGRTDERGVVSIEFALVLPILLAILLATVTGGLAYNRVLGATDGVREGARFGATTPLSNATWGETVKQQTIDLTYLNVSGGPVVVTSAMVCAQLIKAGTGAVKTSSCNTSPTNGAGPAPPDPAGIPAGTCIVKVWAEIPVRIDFVLIPALNKRVQRQSVALYERGSC
jgi:Flp pilus assembly protein TadG